MSRSRTVAVFPIVAALMEGLKHGNALTPFTPVNEQQVKYLENLEAWAKQSDKFSPEELKVIASHDAEVINAWLKDNGFDIKLGKFDEPDDFGTASIMNVLVKWLTPGTEETLTVDGVEYPAAKLTEDISFTRIEGYPYPIVHIHTENGDTVHLTMADESELSDLDLLAKCVKLTDGKRSFDYGGVIFPMIDHNQEVDISFFKEMYFRGRGESGKVGDFRVKEAKAQTMFQMNHKGAKAKAAAAFGFALECCFMPKMDLVVDKPFYVWMNRDGQDVPYFAGYMDVTDWKNPGELVADGIKDLKQDEEPIEEVFVGEVYREEGLEVLHHVEELREKEVKEGYLPGFCGTTVPEVLIKKREVIGLDFGGVDTNMDRRIQICPRPIYNDE